MIYFFCIWAFILGIFRYIMEFSIMECRWNNHTGNITSAPWKNQWYYMMQQTLNALSCLYHFQLGRGNDFTTPQQCICKSKQMSRNPGLTIFSNEEVQVTVGIGHAHFGLHLWSLQGGVNLPWTVVLWHRLHLAQPAAHGSTVRLSQFAKTLSIKQNRVRQGFIVTLCSKCSLHFLIK